MSDQQRLRRRTMLLADAARLEYKAHQLIVEAHELRKTADSFISIRMSCNAAEETKT